jgi:hypothetical protein
LVGERLVDKVSHQTKIVVVEVCIGMEICDLSQQNHIAYCERHGYDYLLLDELVPGVHPKFLKFLALAWALNNGYEWVMMLEADALLRAV